MRYLAIDLGDKRTGLAVADDETRLASPLTVIEIPRAREDDLIEAVADAANDYDAAVLVVGLPLNMDDTEGPRAKLTRAFADQLAAYLKLPIHFQDERLTSASANARMAQTGLTHKQKKNRRDALAAAEILRDFLETL